MTFPTKVVVQTLVHLSLNSCEFSYDRRGNRLLSETSCIAFLAYASGECQDRPRAVW